MFGVDVRQLVCVSLVGVGVVLGVVSAWRGEGPGEDVAGGMLGELRGGDTFIDGAVKTCDSQNFTIPICRAPGTPCVKCSVSSGSKMAMAGRGHGWRVIAQYDCGFVQTGWCNAINVCIPTVTGPAECDDLLLVERQPVTVSK